MTSDNKAAAPLDPAVLAERFQMLATKSQAAVQGFLVDRPDVANIGMGDPAKIGQAFFELTTKLIADPRPIARAQIDLWEQSVSLWARTLRGLLGDEPPPASAPDKRFKHPQWAENAIFSYIRDSYLLSARPILSAVRGARGSMTRHPGRSNSIRSNSSMHWRRRISRRQILKSYRRRSRPAARTCSAA
jgi:polyhydroxyalkanoate synthase